MVELGGLEDDGDDAGLTEVDDKGYQIFSNKDRDKVIFFICMIGSVYLVLIFVLHAAVIK